ncbi:MAG: hypothetical protein ACIAXF_12360 [Phycisphaerales bacterium JB063]
MNRLCLPLVLVAMLLAGCNSPNYINVPGVTGDIAFNDANSSTAVLMEKRALAAVLTEANIPGDVAVRFPEGTSELTAITVVAELPDNVFLDGQAPSGEYTLVEVVKIRARGGSGAVDVIRPGLTRARELVAVEMAYDFFDGWVVTAMRPYAFDVDTVAPNVVAPGWRRDRAPQFAPGSGSSAQPIPDAADSAEQAVEESAQSVEEALEE